MGDIAVVIPVDKTALQSLQFCPGVSAFFILSILLFLLSGRLFLLPGLFAFA